MVLKLKLFLVAVILGVSYGAPKKSYPVNQEEWNAYKLKFNKSYHSEEAEQTAKLIYASNLFRISEHNSAYRNGSVPYKLNANQFTDIEFDNIQAMFPAIDYFLGECGYYFRLTVGDKYSEAFDYTEEGYRSKIHDQGFKCNSGWAYATATALEIFRAKTTSTEIKTVSAQYLIDCAGHDNACRNETPFTSFSYLEINKSPIYDENDYPNTPGTGRKRCVKPQKALNNTLSLFSSKTICDSDRNYLEKILKQRSPFVFEFNQISFEFIHYSEGIFTPPPNPFWGTHYMTVVGYGKDSNGTKYWKLQNSFGVNWGEKGYVRLSYNNWKPFSKIAITPYQLIEGFNILNV